MAGLVRNSQLSCLFLSLWILAACHRPTSLQADDDPGKLEAASGRDVRGVLLQYGQPIEGAVITISDADTGVPLIKSLRQTPTWEEHRMMFEDLWFAQTDSAGKFLFENLPTGSYRLTAQKWLGDESFDHPLEIRQGDVRMLGSMEFEVADEPIDIEFAAATGPNRIRIMGDIDEVSLTLVSAQPPEDAVLGPFALAGPFATNLLGFCSGPLTIEGLPDGNIGVIVIILDNSPGMNTYTFDLSDGETAVLDVREEDMLAGWSNARRGPLPGLEAEMEAVNAAFAAGEEESIWGLIAADTPVAGSEYNHLLDQSDFERIFDVIPQLGPLARSVTLPSGHETTVGRVLAAMAYYEMAQDK